MHAHVVGYFCMVLISLVPRFVPSGYETRFSVEVFSVQW